MHRFEYHDGHLWCEQVPLRDLPAQFGTPLYVYSAETLRQHYERLRAAFAPLDPQICFSVKSCPNINILRRLAERGAGFDVVSGGELHRVLAADGDPARTVFAGVGKSRAELNQALAAGVGMINVESASELALVADVAAERGCRPAVAIRVNPDVDARTHAHTTTGTRDTKFGIPGSEALDLYRKYAGSKAVRVCGLHVHIGSPVLDPEPYVHALRSVLVLVDRLRDEGRSVDVLDIGGGFGADYEGSESPTAQAYADVIVPLLSGWGLRIVLEPGRSIAANAGVLLTRVLHIKPGHERTFVIVDASMNELIRPALYSAYHFVWPVEAGDYAPTSLAKTQPFDGLVNCDVVGPVCETADFLARDRQLPPLRSGDAVAVFTCGAYAMAMASQYNSRPRAAEVLIDESRVELIRQRETYDDLIRLERL